MLKKLHTVLIFTLFSFLSGTVYAQGPDCNNADPFCTGTSPSFPNTTNNGDLGQIDCLGSSPNPAWFFMEIDQPGQMQFTISQTGGGGGGLDVDFILWGPYTSLAAACASNLLSTSGTDCSYSGTSVETATIPNAQPGEVYVLLLTNFSNQPGTITFSQTGGTGTADCSLMCGVTGFTAVTTACVPATNTYGVSGTLSITNPPLSGTLTISNSCGGSQVFNAPFANNINYNFPGLVANGAGCTVSAVWSADPNCNTTTTYTAPAPCNVTPCAITSLTATPGVPNCAPLPGSYSVTGQVVFNNAPASGTLTVSGSCGGSQVFNAPFASPLNYTLNGITANGANCTVTATFSAAAGCTANVNITGPNCPTVNAGPDQTICPGDCINLNGSAPGAISVLWSPATGLSSTTILNPQACPPSTTTYTLTGEFLGANVIVNGNFSAGNTGFTSSYTFTPPPNTGQGQYNVGTNPQAWNGGLSACGDHTTGTGNMMQVNGATTANTDIWCQTVNVVPGTNYQFAAWISSFHPTNYPILQFSVNGVPLGATFTPTGAVCNWEQFFNVWNSGASTTATICIVNQNTAVGGNDFGIDDISFAPVLTASDQVTVTVSGPLNATITPAGPFCENNAAVNLTAVDPGGTWSGTGITNAVTGEFTPSTAGPGLHTIQYLIPGSCGDTATTQIQVINSADATITPAGPFCVLNAPVILTAVDPGGTWSGTGITNAATGEFTPSVAGAGTHTVTYSIVGVCGDVETINITVNGQTPATINPAGPFCIDAPASNLTAVTAGGTWSGVGITSAANGTFNPATAGAGTHTITYISAGSCSDTGTTVIVVNPLPVVNFAADLTANCAPLCVNFTDNTTIPSGTVAQWSWDFGDGGISTMQSPSHCYTNANINTVQYSVTLTATSLAGCSATQTVTNMISVYGIPDADFTFGPQPTTVLYPEISFTNLSLGANTYNWDFGGQGTSSQQNPMFAFPNDTADTYNVCLMIESVNGCVDTICHEVVISEQFLMYVPNAFTPNGDGTNDIFYPIGSGMDLEGYEFFIFNRWGEVIFHTEDATEGWDGTHNNLKAKTDVYVWKLKAKDAATREKKMFYGHVSLLR